MVEKQMKQVVKVIFYLMVCSTSLFAQDIKFIEAAFKDGLYLFVEQNAKELLSKPEVQKQKVLVNQLHHLWVASLLKREAYVDTLARLDHIEETEKIKLSAELQYYKAISLFYVYVKEGEPLPEGEMSPHDMLVKIEMSLKDPNQRKTSKFYRAWDLYEQGEYNRATDLLNLLVNGLLPNDLSEKVKYLFVRSLFFSDPPQYEKCLLNLKELITKYQKSEQMARYHYWRAECYFELNQLEEAEKSYLEVLNHNPDTITQIEVHHNLGWLYSSMGKLELATQHLETLLEPKWKDEKDAKRFRAPSAYKLANLYLLMGQAEKSLGIVAPVLNDEALKYHGELITGEAYLELEAWEEAVVSLKRAQGATDKTIQKEAIRKKAKAHLHLKKYELALEGLNSLINVDDLLPLDYRIQIQLDLAKVYLEMGDVYVAQNIYEDLLKEKSKNIEAGIHYHIAKCAMLTNPLISCLYERDDLEKKLLQGRISPTNYETEKNALKIKVSSVLSDIWNMANDSNDKTKKAEKLYRQDVIAKLGELTGTENVGLLTELRDEHFSEKGDLPSALGQESSMYIKLSEKFLEDVFFNQEKIPDYQTARESLKPLSNVYTYLQMKPISDHLYEVISLGKKSPYLALAYNDKAELYKNLDLPDVVLENLFHAIQATTDPKLKSEYLLDLTKLHIKEANKLVVSHEDEAANLDGQDIIDPKTQKFKVKEALNNLDDILALGQLSKALVTELQYQCHMIITDVEKAEKVLTDFLKLSEPFEDLVKIEELLINFYLLQDLEDEAAAQRLVHANRVEANDIELAHKHRYLAALQFLEDGVSEKRAIELLSQLVAYQPQNNWTYKAALKQAEVFQKIGKIESAAKVLESIKVNKGEALPESLVFERFMVYGRLAMQQNDYEKATNFFKQVYDDALPKHTIKSKAMLEYAGALKQINVSKASDIFLQFYYQFSKHKKREIALLESCELKLKALASTTQPDSKMVAKQQLQQLITKLKSDTIRLKLMDEVNSL